MLLTHWADNNSE